MFDSSIYGIALRTDRPLFTFGEPVSSEVADVEVELAGPDQASSIQHLGLPGSRAGESGFERLTTPDGDYIRITYTGAGHSAVFVLGPTGRRIWVQWNELVGQKDIAALLSGPVMVVLLSIRGLTCLHASAIEVDGRAAAFLGPKGAGKTSTALALVQQGARVISDDVAVLERHDEMFTVRVGRPGLRMRPAPADALVHSFAGLQPLYSREDDRPRKRYLDLSDGDREPRPPVLLDALYLLGQRAPGVPPRIRTLERGSVLPVLMANRHSIPVIDRAGNTRDFAFLADVASRVPLRIVERAEGVEHVAGIASAIMADLADV